jgi:serine/threonine protein kinase
VPPRTPIPADDPRAGPTAAGTFAGTHRFKVIDQLGTGSMCVVYRVRDTQYGDVVALKTLRHLDPNSLYRLKQEFRALSSIDHPNLVSFYELVQGDSGWFVTMELVEGMDFLTFVRGAVEAQRSRARTETSFSQDLRFSKSARSGAQGDIPAVFEPLPDARLPDLVRLRSCLRQVAEGVSALHHAGRIHRDLKPSNVLVTPAGRVVILDFGLVADIDQDYTEGTLHQNIAGSAAYMSPEQSVGNALSDASDWYSVGVMLYEALTGVWPYSGHLYQILTQKQDTDPRPPSALLAGIPADLDELCMALLRRRPEDRPSGRSVLAQLRGLKPQADVRRRTLTPRFRFRDEPLTELHRAFASAKWGHAVVALVRGAPGIGKTTLVRELVKQVKRREPSVLTLKGRCYEWETVTFKALDGVMDNLSRVLRRLNAQHQARIQSDDLSLVAELFPVLSRCDFIQGDPDAMEGLGTTEIAQGAFRGLRDILRTLGDLGPIVLSIDDVHWGDTESAEVLAEILKAERSLPLLVVLSYRSTEPSAFIHWLLPGLQGGQCDVRTIDLEPLSFEQSCVISAEMLGKDPTGQDVRAIALESGGNPHQIREMVRRVDSADPRMMAELSEVVVAAIHALSPAPRSLLELLAVAGQPVSTELAIHAVVLGNEAFPAISTLRAHALINATGGQASGTLEVFSDKIREYVLDLIPEARRREVHGAIAATLEQSRIDDAEALVHHYAGAGATAKAGLVAWLAAEGALEERRYADAIWLLERAVELGEWSARERRSMLSQLGNVLASVGRGREAAAAFLRAVGEVGVAPAPSMRVVAAEQLLACGQIEEGTRLLDGVLVEVGGRRPPSPACLVPATAWMRFRQRLRGLRPEGGDRFPDAEAAVRALAYGTLATTLGGVLPLRAALAQALLLEEVADAAEPATRLVALQLESVYEAARDPHGGGWRKRWEQVQELARTVATPEASALASLSAGSTSLTVGAWADAVRLCNEAEHVIRTRCHGLAFQRFQARANAGVAHIQRGDLRSAAALAYPMLREARAADNPLFRAHLVARITPVLHAAEDDPDAWGRALDEAEEGWTSGPWTAQRAGLVVARAGLDAYRGRAGVGTERLKAHWKAMTACGAFADPVLRIDAAVWGTSMALAIAVEGSDSAALSGVDRWIGRLRRDRAPWAPAWARLYEAGALLVRQDRGAGKALEEARRLFADRDMWLGAALAGYLAARLGQAGDGPLPETWLHEQGVRNTARFVGIFVPSPFGRPWERRTVPPAPEAGTTSAP